MNVPRPLAFLIFAVPWLAAFAAAAILFLFRFPPSGVFTVVSRVDGKNPWIFPFLPAERTSSPGTQSDGWVGQRITSDPVYFSARIPGPYISADVSLEYRVLRQPLIEFGVVRDAFGKDLEMSPMYASELESPSWLRATGQVRGFVRSGIPVSRLSSGLPEGLAVWDASATMPLLEDPSADATTTAISLRGSHDFYFVPAGGNLRANFWFQDANRKEGSDTVSFRVFYGDEEIPQARYAVNASSERRMGLLQHHEVSVSHAKPGAYRISFTAPDDVFLRKIETTSRRWVVGPRVYFGDTVGYVAETAPVHAWTNSRHIVAETFHVEGLQTIKFGNIARELKRTHETYRLDRDSGDDVVRLDAPKGDLRLVLDGFAAMRRDAFFEPKPRRLTDSTRLEAENITAVLTPYEPPEHLADGWLRSTFRIPLASNMDTVRFVLSAPGLAARIGSVDMRSVTIVYRRPSSTLRDWIATIRQELTNAWHRL